MSLNRSRDGFAAAGKQSRCLVLPGLLGAYVSVVSFGFIYGMGNHEYQLPLVNWLHDPTLYPNDPMTVTLALLPTVFWKAVAILSTWISTETLLFLSLVITKVLFFLTLVRILGRFLGVYGVIASLAFSAALSPFFAGFTPFGASDMLNAIQTNTSLAIVLVFCACAFLLEGRWLLAAVLMGVTTYLNALCVIYAGFAFRDTRSNRLGGEKARDSVGGCTGRRFDLALVGAVPRGSSDSLS